MASFEPLANFRMSRGMRDSRRNSAVSFCYFDITSLVPFCFRNQRSVRSASDLMVSKHLRFTRILYHRWFHRAVHRVASPYASNGVFSDPNVDTRCPAMRRVSRRFDFTFDFHLVPNRPPIIRSEIIIQPVIIGIIGVHVEKRILRTGQSFDISVRFSNKISRNVGNC